MNFTTTIFIKFLLLFSVFFADPIASHAGNGDIIILQAENKTWNTNNKVYFFRDASKKVALDDLISSDKYVKKFKKSSGVLHLGVSKDNIWAFLHLQNDHISQQDFIFVIEDPSLSNVELFLVNDKNQMVFHSSSGVEVPQKEKLIKGNRIAFPIRIKAGEEVKVYLKASSNAYFTMPIKIQYSEPFYDKNNQIRVSLGVFYGMILLLGIYNIILFSAFKERVFIYFMASSFAYGLGMGTYDGMMAEYLYPILKLLRFYPEGILMPLCLFLSTIFIREFLGVKKQHKIYRFLQGSSIFAVLCAAFWVFFPLEAIYLAFSQFFLYIVVVSVACAWAYRNKIREGKYLFIASSLFALAGMMSISATLGLFESQMVMTYGLHLGYICNLFVMSLGVTDKMKQVLNQIIHKENQILKEKAKRHIIKGQKNELERMVAERTHELIEQNEQLRNVNNELGKVNAELDRFVYSVSHELRSPLKSLDGLVKLMQYEKPKGQMLEYLKHQERSIKKLDDYAQEIIDLMRNARLEVQKEEIKVEKLVNEILRNHKNHQNFEKTVIKTHIIQHQPFISDEKRVMMVLNNLIGNAFQYQKISPCPEMRVSVVVTDAKVQISISDNGLGIPKEYLSKIFDMFYRVHKESTGSGLGLYIVKQTIEKLKGSIFVTSKQGEGTRFDIEIPNLAKSPENSSQEVQQD